MKKQYPKELFREDHFKCPIWHANEPSFINKLNKASDPYIKEAKKNLKKTIDARNKKYGNRGDMGHVFHSTTLIGDTKFKELQDYIGATAHNLLDEMGFDMTNRTLKDPRPGNMMNLLPEKDRTKLTYATSQLHYKPTPGTIIFFPSYMPHLYLVDMGYEPFRFIHWNCQAIPKSVLKYERT